MDLIFNELSLHEQVETVHEAKERMIRLLRTCIAAKEAANGTIFGQLRVPSKSTFPFESHQLSKNYTILDWLNDKDIPNYRKDQFLSIKRTPFIDESDENVEDRFIQANYRLDDSKDRERFGKDAVEGLST